MSNICVNKNNLGCVKFQLEEFVKSSPNASEADLLTYLDYLLEDLEWADVKRVEIPFHRVWCVRLVVGSQFLHFHIKAQRNLSEQLSELAYKNWEMHGRPSGQDAKFWGMAEEQLKQNWKDWERENV